MESKKVYKGTNFNYKNITIDNKKDNTSVDDDNNLNFELLDDSIDILNSFLNPPNNKLDKIDNCNYNDSTIFKNENYVIDNSINNIINKTIELNSILLSDNKLKIICKLVNNKREGKAKQIFSNGNVLKFNYKNDLRHGKAMLIIKDGIIKFTYKNDIKNGICNIIMLNGLSMTCNYKNDNIEGYAFIKKSSGDIIEFTYKDNIPDDNLIKKYKNGSVLYEDSLKDN